MRKNIFQLLPWLFAILLIPYFLCVWHHTPSNRADNPDCASYASSLSGYEVVTAATDDTAEQHQTKYDDQIKLKAELECSDLHAQWAMADVTFWAFWAGIAGIILVFWTLLATRQASQVSEQAARDELKASISVKCMLAARSFDGEQAHVILFIIENVGQTPAHNITVRGVPFETNDIKITKSANKDVSKLICGYLPQKGLAEGYVKTPKMSFKFESNGRGGFTTTRIEGDEYVVFDGFIEFDDIYTLRDKSLPKRQIVLNRYSKRLIVKNAYGKDAEMTVNHEKESAT